MTLLQTLDNTSVAQFSAAEVKHAEDLAHLYLLGCTGEDFDREKFTHSYAWAHFAAALPSLFTFSFPKDYNVEHLFHKNTSLEQKVFDPKYKYTSSVVSLRFKNKMWRQKFMGGPSILCLNGYNNSHSLVPTHFKYQSSNEFRFSPPERSMSKNEAPSVREIVKAFLELGFEYKSYRSEPCLFQEAIEPLLFVHAQKKQLEEQISLISPLQNSKKDSFKI